MVRADNLQEADSPSAAPPRRRRWALAVVPLALAGGAAFLAHHLSRPGPAHQPADVTSAPEVASTGPPPGQVGTAGPPVVPAPRAVSAVGMPDAAPRPPVVLPSTDTPTTVRSPGTLPATGDLARPTPPAATDSPPVDAHGFRRYQLAKRLDLRTERDLEQELLRVREVSLDTEQSPQTTRRLHDLGLSRAAAGLPYPGAAVAARGRPDLAGLPYRLGSDATLPRGQAEALDALSRQLRRHVQECTPGDDVRPDPDRLFAALLRGEDGLFRDRKWATPEAVPCVQQMLQAEGAEVRRMAVELLRGWTAAAATEALVRWAVFDLDAGNRAAAVDALRGRDRFGVNALLLGYLRYPWPRAAEHAAEALVELRARDVAPDLAALLLLPDPDAPQPAAAAGSAAAFRREMVRVNHPRNCLLCHPPSAARTDLVRGAVPDPARPLPGAITPGYYQAGSRFAHASATYVRQEFSTALPVRAPGPWPAYQRYDFLTAVRPAAADERAGDPAYRGAVLFALRELTGRDLGASADAWSPVRGGRTPPDDRLTGAAARFLALSANPDPLVLLALREFGGSFLSLSAAERAVVVAGLRRAYGGRAAWFALVAYLDGVARTGDPAARDRAARLLAEYLRTADPDAAGGVVDPDAAVRLLASPSAQLRAAAARAVGSLGVRAKDRYGDLLRALKDPEPDVRQAAAAALGDLTFCPAEAHDALAAATGDAAGAVRVAAADALLRLKLTPRTAARGVAEGLVAKRTWDTPEQQREFARAAAEVLAGMRARGAAAYPVVLAAAAGEAATDVPAATLARLLEGFGPVADAPSLPALVRLLDRAEFRPVAEAHLVAAGDDAVEPLIAGLRDPSPRRRAAAAAVLGKAASLGRTPPAARKSWRAAMDALAPLKASDPSPDVRAAAATALAGLTANP